MSTPGRHFTHRLGACGEFCVPFMGGLHCRPVDSAAQLPLDHGQGGGDDEVVKAVMAIAIELSANAHSVLVLVVMGVCP